MVAFPAALPQRLHRFLEAQVAGNRHKSDLSCVSSVQPSIWPRGDLMGKTAAVQPKPRITAAILRD
jgi:hypothetical protein